MKIRTQTHPKIITYDDNGKRNGYLVPIYNINDHFFEPGHEPQQVYITAIAPGCSKGPHLHHIRFGFFTCIKGNVRVITKLGNKYAEHDLGEEHQYLSIEIPTGVAALIQNLGNEEAIILNMPNPAWTPDMNDEYTADFSDFLSMKMEKEIDPDE